MLCYFMLWGRVLRLGKARGPSAAAIKARGPSTPARTGQGAEYCGQERLGGRVLRLGKGRGPSATARTGKGAENCGKEALSSFSITRDSFQFRLGCAAGYKEGRTLRLGQAMGPSAAARIVQEVDPCGQDRINIFYHKLQKSYLSYFCCVCFYF